MQLRVAATMAALVAGIALASCAQTDALVARDRSDPSFAPSSDAGDASLDARRMCPSNACPEPFASCGTGFPCSTDLSRDPSNCGACGNVCPSYEPVFMRGHCLDGQCVVVCENPVDNVGNRVSEQRDCNGAVDDGCESDLFSDEENCGACGNVCDAGVECRRGRCGCPPGETLCEGDDRCWDLSRSRWNCGECGNICRHPAGCLVTPHVEWLCADSTCKGWQCENAHADCNHDVDTAGCESDGCETSLLTDTNCGACGNVCPAGTHCEIVDATYVCKAPEPAGCSNIDVLNDVLHCGGCGLACPARGPNELVSCEKGVCVSRCIDGFADCNGIRADGCEINLLVDPAHCGACENACNGIAGQACVEGKCLMSECPPER